MGHAYLLIAALLSLTNGACGFHFQGRRSQATSLVRPTRYVTTLRARRYESYTVRQILYRYIYRVQLEVAQF